MSVAVIRLVMPEKRGGYFSNIDNIDNIAYINRRSSSNLLHGDIIVSRFGSDEMNSHKQLVNEKSELAS